MMFSMRARTFLHHLLAASLVLLPSVAASAGIADEVPKTINQLVNAVCRIGNWFFALLIVSAVLVFLWAGATFLFGGSNEQSLQKAKRFVFYGIIGIALAVLSRGLVVIIAMLLGVSRDTILQILTNPTGPCAET